MIKMSKIKPYEKPENIRHPNSEISIDVRDLKKYFSGGKGYDDVKAVDGVSFQIHDDEILGLVGETGCGKSVTAL